MIRHVPARLLLVPVLVFVLALLGCEKRGPKLPPKSPRPVTTITLALSNPTNGSTISGSVQSWKTEQIGFEVPGRLLWVLEPGKNIEGQIRDKNNQIIRQGTALAQIDPTQYEVAVETAKANVEVARLEKKVIEIRIRDVLPEEINSAKADLKLAETEFERIKTLRAQNAVSQSDYDTAENRVKTQLARLTNLNAGLLQADAELKASQASVIGAEQALRDAQRNLDNTTLYASYRGQISDVSVVPGSVVSAGSPILKLQMMNPIKVEIEVSARQSRMIQQQRQASITFVDQEGTVHTQKAMVYLVDPSANSSTRTFSVTLLVRNSQYLAKLPASLAETKVARSQNLWPLNVADAIEGTEGIYLVDENAIESDDEGSFVWLASGLTLGDPIPETVRVEKKRVTLGEFLIPFLGNWMFRQVTFEDASITPTNMIAGKLEFPDNPREHWDGQTLFLDNGKQWLLRPGDLVSVNIDPEFIEPGFHVPVSAVYQSENSSSIFVVVDSKAKRIEVNAVYPDELNTDSQVRIESVNSGMLDAGMQIVVGGVHYLEDGDAVNVVQTFQVDEGP